MGGLQGGVLVFSSSARRASRSPFFADAICLFRGFGFFIGEAREGMSMVMLSFNDGLGREGASLTSLHLICALGPFLVYSNGGFSVCCCLLLSCYVGFPGK